MVDEVENVHLFGDIVIAATPSTQPDNVVLFVDSGDATEVNTRIPYTRGCATHQSLTSVLNRDCPRLRFFGVPMREIGWKRTATAPTRTHKPRVAGSNPAAATFSPSRRQIWRAVRLRGSATTSASILRGIHCARTRPRVPELSAG
jgi:hypothetical protein